MCNAHVALNHSGPDRDFAHIGRASLRPLQGREFHLQAPDPLGEAL